MPRSYYPAVIVPDERFTADTFDAGASTLTQAGPLPGIPAAPDGAAMLLEAGGVQAAGETRYVRVSRAGMPGVDSLGVLTRLSSDDADEWLGWEMPTSLTAWSSLDYTTTANAHRQFCLARTADGLVLVEFAATRYVKAWSCDTAGTWAGPVTIYDNGAAYGTTTANPCLAVMQDGSVVCYFLVENDAGTYANVYAYRSEDAGATWSLMARNVLRQPLDLGTYTVGRLRAAQLGGQVVLVAWVVDTSLTWDDVLMQWASGDGGCSFSHVDTWTGADAAHHGGYHDLAVAGSSIVLAYLKESAPASGYATPYIVTIGSAYTPLSEGATTTPTLAQGATNAMRWGTIAANALTAGDLALTADENGVLYVTGRDLAGTHACVTYMSLDGGTTWLDSALGGSTAPSDGPVWYFGNDTSTHPKAMSGAWWRGSLYVAHAFAASPGTADDSLCVAVLGGWTRVEMPLETDTSRWYGRASWEWTYLPFDLPDNTGGLWTLGTAGAPTISLTAGALYVTQGLGASATYTSAFTITSTLAQGTQAEIAFDVDTGEGWLEVRAGVAGPHSYRVKARFDGTDLVVSDEEAASDIGTVTPGSSHIAVRMWVGNRTTGTPGNDGEVRVWYRRLDTVASDPHWIEVESLGTLTKGADTSNRVRFGTSTGAADVYVERVLVTAGAQTGTTLMSQVNPSTLQGRPLSGVLADLDAGMTLRATDGPGYVAETHTIATRYEHPVEAMHHEVAATPQRGWRSTSDASGCTLVWTLPSGDTGLSTSRSVGVYFGRINFRSADIYFQNLAGTWTKYGTLDAADGQRGGTWVREGSSIRPDTTVSQGFAYSYGHHELAGAHIELDNGGSTFVRTIRTNGEGAWQGSGTSQRVSLVLTDGEAGDPSSGTAAAILSRDCVVVMNDVPAYKAVKIVIGAQDTAEEYFEIGTLIVGPVHIFARPYSMSRDRGLLPQYELATTRTGTRRARRLGPTRRYVEFGWEEGVDLSKAYGTAPTPEPIALYSSGPGVGSTADTPYTVAGLLDRIGGAVVPVVYLASLKVESTSTAEVTVVQRRAMLYGRVVSEDTRLTTIHGEEHRDPGEVVRVSRVRIEEEV